MYFCSHTQVFGIVSCMNLHSTQNAKEHFLRGTILFVIYSFHNVINNSTYQIARMRSLDWASLHNLDMIYFVLSE